MPRRIAFGIFGLALGASALAASQSAPGFSFAGTSAAGITALMSPGYAAMACGLVHWAKRPGSVGPLLLCAGAAWFVAEWDSPGVSSSLVFSAGLLMYAACPAFVAHVTLAYPTGRLGSWLDRIVVGVGYATAIGFVGLAPTLFFDPRALGCRDCADNLLLVSDRSDLVTQFNRVAVRLGFAWALLSILAVCWRLVRSSTARRRVTTWVALAGSAYLVAVAWSFGSALSRGSLGNSEFDRTLWLIQGAALVALSLAVGWGLLRSRRTGRALARLVVELDRAAPPGRLRDALAEQLGDPDFEIAYRIGADRYVDAAARPVTLPPGDGRTTTTLTRAGSDIAVLVHRAGLLDNPHLVDELGTAAHLGFDNERLQAEALAQLSDLRASRARIVEAGDEERRMLERDLHDGAQQRLLGLALGLQLLRSRLGKDSPQLVQAEAKLRTAIDELRDLAHGLYPVVLRDAGLAAALGALSETYRVRITCAPEERFPLAVETTAYLVVARAAKAGPMSVAATTTRDRLVVNIEVEAEASFDGMVDLGDRVAALEGHLDVSSSSGGRTRIDLVLPFAAAAATKHGSA